MQTEPDTVLALMSRYGLRIIEDRFEGGLSLTNTGGSRGGPSVRDYKVAPDVVTALLERGAVYRNPYTTFAVYHVAD